MIIRLQLYRKNLTQFRNTAYSNQSDRVAQLAEHWASIPKVVGSSPTLAGISSKPFRCGYTLKVTSHK